MRTDWKLQGLLFVAGLFAAAQFAKVALTIGPLSAVYPGQPIPIAVSAQSVMGVLFGVTAGVIVARLGVRKVLLAALVLGGVLSGLQALLPPFPVFLALRLAEGGAHLSMVVAAPTLMAAAAGPRDVPVVMGLWGTFFGIGFAVSAVLIPYLGGPDRVFAAHGIGLLGLAAILWPLLPRGAGRPPPSEGFVARHLTIYRSPRLLAPALGFVWHAVTFLGLLTFLPGVLGARTGPLLPLAALAGTLGAGVLARRIVPGTLLIGSFLATAAGLLTLIVLPEALRPVWALGVFAVIGVTPGASFANIPHLNADTADRARAAGALAQFGNIGTALSTPIFAAALAAGLPGLAGLAALLSLVGAGVVLLIHRKIAVSP